MNAVNPIKSFARALLIAAGIILLVSSVYSRGGKLAPPAALDCDRNQVTSWTGEVTEYKRSKGSTHIQVDTDFDTVEQITLRHPDSKDPSGQYLLMGEPFGKSDWKEIEARRGTLKPGMRATVWICDDNPLFALVDWRPGEGKIGVPE